MDPIIAPVPLTTVETVVAKAEDVRKRWRTRVECDGVASRLGAGNGQQDRDEKYGRDGMNRVGAEGLGGWWRAVRSRAGKLGSRNPDNVP